MSSEEQDIVQPQVSHQQQLGLERTQRAGRWKRPALRRACNPLQAERGSQTECREGSETKWREGSAAQRMRWQHQRTKETCAAVWLTGSVEETCPALRFARNMRQGDQPPASLPQR